MASQLYLRGHFLDCYQGVLQNVLQTVIAVGFGIFARLVLEVALFQSHIITLKVSNNGHLSGPYLLAEQPDHCKNWLFLV